MKKLPSRMHVSGLELMGALGRPTFRSWGLINVENLVCQKKKKLLWAYYGSDWMGWCGWGRLRWDWGFIWKE